MNNQSVFSKVILSADAVDNKAYKHVLALYEEEIVYIGDCCVRFDKFRYFKTWLKDAAITMNFSSKKNEGYYHAILKNSPFVDRISSMQWEEIDFRLFDAVICIMQNEQPFIDFLNSKYQQQVLNDEMKLDVYVVQESESVKDHVDLFKPGELFITNEEQQWANNWLIENGYQQGESLFVMVDSSSSKKKLVDTVVYFELIKHLLNRPNTRLLVFDENNMGKQEFYQQWVGEDQIGRIIFSKGRSLRDNLCLIGSSYTKMVFGPCTGVMHCASGIYNNYVNNGLPPDKVPVLITYTGVYPVEGQSANRWWGNCPLINCIMLKRINGRKVLLQLHDLTPEEKGIKDTLVCSEYTAGMLIDYVNEKLEPAKEQAGAPVFIHAKKVLVLFEEDLLLLGDTCIMLDKLRYLKEYLNQASIAVNFKTARNQRFYEALLQNNPHIDEVFSGAWQNLPPNDFDLLICVAFEENKLQARLQEWFNDRQTHVPVYSISELLLKPTGTEVRVYPVLDGLAKYLHRPRPGELYISAEEQQWADDWLASKGLQKEEELFIIIDSAAVKNKLLNYNVYFELLKGLLDGGRRKVLIFDERRQGKRHLYKGWLGEERMSKMIFSEGLSLREDLCLLGSSHTRLVLGPCTGLMHCASRIFNYYKSKGLNNSSIPLLVVYTGMSGDENYDIRSYWGSSPLVNCLLLKHADSEKKLHLLGKLPEGESITGSLLPCSEYTADMLLGFINNRFTDNRQHTLKRIVEHTQAVDIRNRRNILILYEERSTMLGDSCIKSDKFRHFRSYLNSAAIHLNFTNKQNQKYYEGLLKNNPYLDSVTALQWDDIVFDDFDAVICITYNEDRLLEFLHNKYGDRIANGQMKLPVYSMSGHILRAEEGSSYIFPENTGLSDYMKVPRLGELYISKEEQQWANSWLEANGMKKHEKLVIMIDSSAVRSKLLNIDVYFDILKYILEMDDIKVLIFDEQNIGKQNFYSEWLSSEAMGKLIFSKGLSLRQDLCLIGSGYTSFMFGPCTGLMHCASSIFNNYVSSGMDAAKIPPLVVYTGWYGKDRYDVHVWWEKTPLVSCLLLKERNNKKGIVVLADLSDEEKKMKDSLPCKEYTADMLIRFIAGKYTVRTKQLTA
ncbi:hypothetical protein A4D02_34765 [Niastella koreensis]|uniref:Uncharacterized protein n=3 Tax=Niastella koreensis TaxID=354356 RepID=G8TKJ7_NIAKG|nr:hypothetical protein Niako_2327 [Niastella koreensis GR20-10]OQP44389.1 hypothetical protein A4D02_34765 [Niastella koreensis]